ncbi:frequency clock protein-domain-containing protein [Geopyxis carbonaria]|nr:frequency clock protein-domain-containing protein [Geopyxis carbonaria]
MPHGMLESTEESNSESFRSVIDDLTIKNQKLKKRLRKLEGLRGRDQGERLFEVRIHDLPEGKKNELERLLQKFSASLDPNHVPSGTSSGNNIAAADQSTTPGGGDSGYNTMPRPGDSPMGISSSHGSKSSDQLRPWPNAQTNVELSKMKTVVKKLEQLFTGGDPMMNDRTQLLQQQDISNTAAADDREARIAHGEFMDPEGAREASLMSPVPYNVQTNYQTAGEPKMQISGNSSPVEAEEQRPTRPLDLDPSRRQVAEDNIEYLTHMTESSTKGFGIGGGWVYLNLIINLAQLHTINVTPPFVKKAIATASNKIELSPDGKMVRWRGGCEGTLFGGSSNADSGCMSGDNSGDQSPPNHAEQAAKAARKQTSQVGSSNSGLAQDKSQNSPSSADSKFHYKPIFAQSQSFDDESSSAMTSSDSDSNDALKRNGSEDYVNGVPKKQTGPIIYYKGGNFCTDLSATPPGPGSPPAALHSYERVTNRPLGAKSDTAGSPGTKTSSPLYQAQLSQMSDDDAMDLDRHDVPIEFQPEFTAVSPTSPRPPIEFEVSGIGGVLPADNFAINCQTKHYLLPESHGRLPLSRTRTFKSKVQKRIPHRIPQASIDAFYDEDQATDSSGTSTTSVSRVPRVTRIPTRPSRKRPLRHELLSAKTLKLPPSQLPPASYIFASPSEESSYGETDSDEPPQSMNSDEYYFNMAALPPHAYRSSSGEENESGPSGFERSPSSAATAGDGSVAGSVFSVASAADENTFDAPLSMDDEDQSSSAGSSGNGFTMFPPGRYMNLLAGDERPQLKRPRGSVYSSTSTNQVRKSARTGTMSTMSTSS